MYDNYPVDIVMKEMILEGGFFDEVSYSGTIDKYDEDAEVLYISINDELPIYSLDAAYECIISDSDGKLISCEGAVSERYQSKGKKMIVFQIQKGFNKKNENSL